MAVRPGIPRPIKLQDQHKILFPLDKPITEESGKLIAQWAAGGTSREVDYGATITAATTLEELSAAWIAIPKAHKPTHEAAKDARKKALTQAPNKDNADFIAGLESAEKGGI